MFPGWEGAIFLLLAFLLENVANDLVFLFFSESGERG